MNTHQLYVVIDTVANDVIGGVQLHRADASAIRTFSDIASHPDSVVARHPDDFTLWRVGTLSVQDGVPVLEIDPVLVMHGSTWAAAQNPSTSDEDSRS